jgi:hypothetical protein
MNVLKQRSTFFELGLFEQRLRHPIQDVVLE